jgi:endonuclease/exonuclease/phosphatase family metal-dependent hydrolase
MEISVLSFNLRVNTDVDKKHQWNFRKEFVFNFLNENNFDLIGFQEVTPSMYTELKEKLNNYISFCVGRDQDNEATPIFIKKEKFDVIENNTLWLTKTPYEESKLSGSNFKRIVTFAVLKTKENNQIISFFNTHLDYQDEFVIFNQAEYLFKYLSRISARYNSKMILTGDFNQHPNQLAIQFLESKFETIYRNQSDYKLTFHGYSSLKDGLPIDYIFYTHDLELINFKINQRQPKDQYLSDHYPLEAQFKIK